jgi:hypothetical protein
LKPEATQEADSVRIGESADYRYWAFISYSHADKGWGDDKVAEAKARLQEATNLAAEYSGSDQQALIDSINQSSRSIMVGPGSQMACRFSESICGRRSGDRKGQREDPVKPGAVYLLQNAKATLQLAVGRET